MLVIQAPLGSYIEIAAITTITPQPEKSFLFVLKSYLPAHIKKCQTSFLFNFIPRVSQTNGKASERKWMNINPVTSSTKEMGLGVRCNALDDHFGYFNWKKITSLGGYSNNFSDFMLIACRFKHATEVEEGHSQTCWVCCSSQGAQEWIESPCQWFEIMEGTSDGLEEGSKPVKSIWAKR